MMNLRTAERISAATPATRERYVDLLRAFSIIVVVFGHWLLAVVTWDGQGFRGENALSSIPWTRRLTWFLQVMPLFFFVGGFSNYTSWRKRPSAGTFIRSRFARLLKPLAVFAGTWAVMAAAMLLGGVPVEQVGLLLAVVAIPLWFMWVYLVVIALAPVAIRAHERFGVRVPVALSIAALAVDIASRVMDIPVIGLLNFVLVWAVPHQLGLFYADGSLARAGRATYKRLAVWGLGTLVLVTQLGLYPVSMVGVPGAPASNNSPPSAALIALSCWLIGAAMLLRDPVSRWLQRPRVWGLTVGVNLVIMTAYLWHMTALILGALVLLPLGWPAPEVGTGTWWLARIPWVAVLTLVLTGFIQGFARFERARM